MHYRGYKPGEVKLVMSQETHDIYFSDDRVKTELGNKNAAGMGRLSAIEDSVRNITGIVAAVGTNIVIPGSWACGGPAYCNSFSRGWCRQNNYYLKFSIITHEETLL